VVNRSVNNFINKLAAKVFYEDEELKHPGGNIVDAVEQARKEWIHAQSYFETVTDPDLVDHAIFLAQAAQKRYIYLLKKAREEGVSLNLGQKG